MTWTIAVAKRAEKELSRAPTRDGQRLVLALDAIVSDPFSGDIVQLRGRGQLDIRRRVGSWRIFYSVDKEARTIEVTDIARRTSTTY